MRRFLALLLVLIPTLAAADEPDSTGRWERYYGESWARPPEKEINPDSLAFFAAVDSGRHSEALALLWAKTNAPRSDRRARFATYAAGFAGTALFFLATDQISDLKDIDQYIDTDDQRGTWRFVQVLGLASVACAIWADF